MTRILNWHRQQLCGHLKNDFWDELRKHGLHALTEKGVHIQYEGEEVGIHRLDLLVEENLIVELKTVEHLGKAHYAQVRSYLKATGLTVALLVNFAKERADFRRIEI